MTGETTLGSQEFERALAVLQREQEVYMPSARQKYWFRIYNWVVSFFIVFFVLYVAFIALMPLVYNKYPASNAPPTFLAVILLVITALLVIISLIIVPLFFLNVDFMLKLFEQSRLRRRLNLDKSLNVALKSMNWKTKIINILSMLLTIVLGCSFIIGGITLVAVATEDKNLFIFIVAIAMIVVGLGFVSFHFIRRGKQKLEKILTLQATLVKQKERPEIGRDSSVQLSPSEYEGIARIETAQIIEDRARSIGLARHEAPDATYLIQNSKEMLSGKDQLDLETRARVEAAVLQLSTEPSPSDAAKDSETGVLRLPVPETSVEILYQIDKGQHRILLLSLRRANASEKVEV